MDALNGQKMVMPKTTRTHLIYQFIILTLVLLSIGYNELLPDRKFLIFLAFLPIFCYQLFILSCCMELMPVPSWMSFLQLNDGKCNTSSDCVEKDFGSSSSSSSSRTEIQRVASFHEVKEMPSFSRRRWENSALNLGATPKCLPRQQRSKSWVNLSDSKSSESLSCDGSLDLLAALSENKSNSTAEKRGDKSRRREERNAKAKSWKPGVLDYDISSEKEFTSYKDIPVKEHVEKPHPLSCEASVQVKEDSELSKSYSFPFRQKRLETWLELKETNVAESNKNQGMPYWQTVGYNLAVKYEARRRKRALENSPRTDNHNELSQSWEKSTEIAPESSPVERTNAKKSAKSAAACMNKIKLGLSNLRSRKKEEVSESVASNANKLSKSNLFKLKNKSTVDQRREKDPIPAMPEFPQFLSNDRPLIFYPKYIPFEKDRFENDVRKKIIELSEEKKGNLCNILS